jgi:hypothetical protein
MVNGTQTVLPTAVRWQCGSVLSLFLSGALAYAPIYLGGGRHAGRRRLQCGQAPQSAGQRS